MNGPEFFQTLLWRQFYEGTLPSLVKEMGRLATGIERLATVLETAAQASRTPAQGITSTNEAKEKHA